MSQANAHLELAVRGSNINIYEINMPDGVLENGRWEAISVGDQNSGFDRSELPTDFAGFLARVHPDDRERVERAVRDYLSGQTRQYEAEYRVRLTDGAAPTMWTPRAAWPQSAATQRARAGIRFMVSSVDITDLKRARGEPLRESEQRFRTFVDHASTDAFFLF